MKPKPPCPACGHPPASMIEDGYSIDLTPWWRYYVQKFNPFKRRRRMVPMDDVKPMLDALEYYITTCDYQTGKRASQEIIVFINKHPLP